MSLRAGQQFVIWTEYFDQELSYRMGRRLPKNLAIHEPNLKLLSEACDALNIPHLSEGGKAFPAQWWRRGGRILVEKKVCSCSKQELLHRLAKKMRSLAAHQGN